MKLISMTDFVLTYNAIGKNTTQKFINWRDAVINYAAFLKQPLELEMFIPCDENGDILVPPSISDYDEYCLENGGNILKPEGEKEYYEAINKYHKAKEKVVFKGFEVDFEEGCGYPFLNNHPPFFFSIDNKWEVTPHLRVVEDLVDYDITLIKDLC